MRYLVLLYDNEAAAPEYGTPEWDADLAGYAAFDELAGDAVVGGEALHGSATARTVRHDGTSVRVTDGPFAETTEVLGGFYVLEAPTLDDVIELARRIPVVTQGAIEIRPLAQWIDPPTDSPAPEGTTRYLATMHGPETAADTPNSAEWDAAIDAHQAFGEIAGDAIVGGGAVHPTSTATTIRMRDGELIVTDGPFCEATQIVGGFYLLRSTDDSVMELASAIPVNDGGAVEVRPVLELD
ncbi:MAG: transcription initiation protein [Acidimicrobiia bacterium]|nr:transcription initiation protein [Acidimicrobiia bacterium]